MNKKELVSHLQIEISPLDPSDIEHFDPILRRFVRDRDTGQIVETEIQNIKKYMAGGIDQEYGRTRKYFVAKTQDGRILGCMALTTPDPDMVRHFNTTPEESIELVNAFVDPEFYRGGGIGRRLFEHLCVQAHSAGKKFLILNSGPWYKDSWGFYDRMCDQNCGFIIGKFGPDGNANTWLKRL